MVRCGGVVSSVTCTLAVVTTLFGFVATAVRVFRPSTNGTVATNWPALIGALMPFTLTCAPGSPTVPLTVTGVKLV